MRTTINLPDTLLKETKRAAMSSGRTLTRFIEDALRAALARTKQGQGGAPVRLTTHGGTGLRPGVDLDDSAGLLDLMEAGPAADRR
jgi:hypothetical protein